MIQQATSINHWERALQYKNLAKKISGKCMRFDGPRISRKDLINEGLMELEHVSRTFDESKGMRFDVYAYKPVLRRMIRYIQNNGHGIRIPVYVQDEIRKIGNLSKHYKEVEDISYGFTSIDVEKQIIRTSEDLKCDIINKITIEELLENIKSKTHLKMFRLFIDGKNYSHIGVVFHITRERVRQIFKEIIGNFRDLVECKVLPDHPL